MNPTQLLYCALPWLIWLAVSLIGGGLATAILLKICGRCLKTLPPQLKPDDASYVPGWFTGIWMGLFERLFFTTVVALGGVGPCMAAVMIWITLKAQTHYNVFATGQGILNRKQAYLALLGSLISLGFAIVAGHQIYGHLHK